jgi:hypothetical protein
MIDFRIVTDNYFFDNRSVITATSSDASFPSSNLTDYMRAKVWRSSGQFEVTASNKYIDFKETLGGPEITATLTEGSYTQSSLATEIKSQMESVSLNTRTYTISYSTANFKWTITGQTYLELLFSTGTNVANGLYSSIGFASSDLSGAITYTGSKAACHTNEAVQIDLLSQESIDTLAILFDPITYSQLSSSAVIKFQANNTPYWVSPSVDVTLSYDENKNIITYFPSSSLSYRYFRINIVDPQNTDGYVELGKIYLGKKLALTRVLDNGYEYKIKDQSKYISNDYGHEYVDIYPIIQELKINYNIINYDNIDILENAYRKNRGYIPVIACMDTQESMYDKDSFFIYGRLQKDFTAKQIVMNYFTTGFTITEVL